MIFPGDDKPDQTANHPISGTGNVTKTGTGILTLAGAGTYSGGSTLDFGVINLIGNGTLGTGSIALASGTTLNINTASAQTLMASMPRLDMAQAQRLVTERERTPFKNLADASSLLPALVGQLADSQHGTRSRFFEVRGRLRLDDAIIEERSLVVRDNLDVRVFWRERIAAR